jgi:cellulose synthase/poly-beta-1,6-N-acetylglucosamine synthase-like glycosyltransferase
VPDVVTVVEALRVIGIVGLLAATVVLLAPTLVLSLQCLLASAAPDRCRLTSRTPGPLAVLVPAHDEAAGIEATVTDLRRQLRPGDRLLVVADNCTDATASVARAAGAEVVERVDPARRGKGHALAFGVRALTPASGAEPPSAVVVVDADCRLSPGAVVTLAGHALETGRPIQADYVLDAVDPSARSALSALAFLVRNRVRVRALAALGLPCQLTGSGMAFPWPLIARGPLGGAHIVEDLLVGLELGLIGRAPLACTRSHVRSHLAERPAAAATQRTRWEHGHLAVLRSHAPRLLRAALGRAPVARRVDLLAQALDLLVPPLTLLVLLLLAALAAGAVVAGLGGTVAPLALALAGLTLLGLSIGAAWWRFGRDVVSARQLMSVPAYVLWKLPIYASLLLGGAERRWVRTQRG